MSTARFNVLRLRYKAAFDAAQAVVQKNAEIVRNGGQLTAQDNRDAELAQEAVEAARQALLAATSRLDA